MRKNKVGFRSNLLGRIFIELEQSLPTISRAAHLVLKEENFLGLGNCVVAVLGLFWVRIGSEFK